MTLDIFPDQLPGIGAGQSANAATLNSVIDTCVAQSTPLPPAMDLVSNTAAVALGCFALPYYLTTTVGAGYLAEGGEVLIPISSTFLTTDTLGGAEISAMDISAQA